MKDAFCFHARACLGAFRHDFSAPSLHREEVIRIPIALSFPETFSRPLLGKGQLMNEKDVPPQLQSLLASSRYRDTLASESES